MKPASTTTLVLCLLDGLRLHGRWWWQAWGKQSRSIAPLGVRRLLLLLFGMPLFVLVQSIHGVCLLLDELLFRRYKHTEIDQALFITGIPRSGTTFLHRSLADSSADFTTFTTWEALLAPSVLQRKIIQALGFLDRKIGRPVQRLLAALTRRASGNLADIHEVGLKASEEDYLALLPLGGCFIMLLAFPAAIHLQQLGQLDSMAQHRRQRLLRVYRSLLQRHVFAQRGKPRLLSKNAAFASWTPALAELFPKARFIICIRNPAPALSSQISAVRSAKALFGTRVDSQAFQGIFLRQFAANYALLAQTLAGWSSQRATVVEISDLRANPGEIILAALNRLGLAANEQQRAALNGLTRNQPSSHAHSTTTLAVSSQEIDQSMQDNYERLLSLPHRISGS